MTLATLATLAGYIIVFVFGVLVGWYAAIFLRD